MGPQISKLIVAIINDENAIINNENFNCFGRETADTRPVSLYKGTAKLLNRRPDVSKNWRNCVNLER